MLSGWPDADPVVLVKLGHHQVSRQQLRGQLVTQISTDQAHGGKDEKSLFTTVEFTLTSSYKRPQVSCILQNREENVRQKWLTLLVYSYLNDSMLKQIIMREHCTSTFPHETDLLCLPPPIPQ